MVFKALVSVVLVGMLAGCSASNKSVPLGHLQVRVAQIENQLDEHDINLDNLQANVDDLSTRVEQLASAREPIIQIEETVKVLEPATPDTSNTYQSILRVPVAPQEVQLALQNAGYYQGAIDGKLGNQSKKAIYNFQSDHDLVSDGIIGKKTWAELKNYLE